MTPTLLRVLLIEDNPADARLLRELFRDAYGAEPAITHVLTLGEAQRVLSRSAAAFDVVMLDLSLPDGSGLHTLERIKRLAPGTAVVVLTGFDDEETALAAMQSGAQDYLVKGKLDGSLLARAIRYSIERHRAEEAGRRLLREQAARAEAEAAERRSRFLAEVSRLLVAEAQPRDSLDQVTRLAVSLLGGGCRIDLLEQSALTPTAWAHAEPSQEEALRLSPTPSACALGRSDAQTYARGEPVIVSGTDLFDFYGQQSPGFASAVLVAPLLARGRSLGRMLLVREDVPVEGAEAPRSFAREDVTLVTACASRIALSIDNARLLAARNEVLAVVSHDMRNPLMLINTAVAMLERSEPASAQQTKRLGTIKRASTQMTRLIRDLLDVTSIDAGQLSLTRGEQDVKVLLEEALEMLRPLADEKKILLEVATAGALPKVSGDHDRLLQVLGNLVGNAVKFTPEGGRVTLHAVRDGTGLRFTVADTGPGIPPDLLPHVFDRYWQARRDGREGVGLGLAIARGIVQAHGGRLWAESRPGEGAQFHFTIPLDPNAAHQAA